jgi:Kyakuja-Dileera-Zisupton transposase
MAVSAQDLLWISRKAKGGASVPVSKYGLLIFYFRQINMDYGLSEALESTCSNGIRRVILAYDINCQYSVKLHKRMKEGQYLALNEDLIFVYGIGLFHVHSHQDSCYARYALTYIKGAGMASGEILESLWSTLNEAARTTSTMTLAHRAEVLNALLSDNNWKKMLSLGRLAATTPRKP